MFSLKSGLSPVIPWLIPAAVFAAPVTYQFDGPKDTVCIVADFDRDPQVPPADSGDWENHNRDTVWQSVENGITLYDVRYTRNFSVELEGVKGVGWNNLYYSHYDYPNSFMYSYDAELDFIFEKGDRQQTFVAYGALLEDYPGSGALSFGLGSGGLMEQQSGMSLYRFQNGVQDTAQNWFVLSKITNGIARCPGREKAWKFSLDGSGEPPACEERPRPGHRQGHKPWSHRPSRGSH